MQAQTFIDTLRLITAELQATHPDRAGDIGRAHAAIIDGHVRPRDLEAGEGEVLSSDCHTWYALTGATCTCEAGHHGQSCQHRSAWKLYRYVAQRHAQTLPPPVHDDWGPPLAARAEAQAPLTTEAPVSVNCYVQVEGHQVQITLRDPDAVDRLEAILARLTILLQQYPRTPAPAPCRPADAPSPSPTPAAPVEGWCAVHDVQMGQSTKNGDTWYSHKLGTGKWCRGKAQAA